jgi:outer membrane receptor for ferrienterochelin and colicin
MKLLLTLLSLFLAVATWSQTDEPKGTGRLSGAVVDENNKPVEFATVALVDTQTKKPVDGSVCDEKGKFIIKNIAAGEFLVVISFVGYKTVQNGPYRVAARGTDINLGVIRLESEAQLLNEVVVEGQKDLIEERVDRTIYNAENDQTTRGGDATDVLRRVPQLTVDFDGNVSLRGSQNVQVLINNKPSTIVASSVADALRQIPADQIKTVEVITSPSARYDAEGSAGIINIITKKNTLQGLTLNIDGGVGYRGSNLGLSGNYRRKKMGFSLGGFGRANYNIDGSFENFQNNLASGLQTVQRAGNRTEGLFGNYNLGWDYDINPKNSLAANVRLGVRNNFNYQDGLLSQTFMNGSMLGSSLRNVRTEDLSNTIDFNVSYTRQFAKPQRELSFLALLSRNDRNNDFTNAILNASTEEIIQRIKNRNDALNTEMTLQLDYQTPIGQNQMIEFGAKDIRRLVLSDFRLFSAVGADGEYVQNTSAARSNNLNYSQDVASAYFSHTYSAKNGYGLKTGLRYEYTTITAFSRTERDIPIPEYGVLVPSLNASKRLKKGTVKVSFNRRVQRPGIQFLNPNRQDQNPLNVSFGNPRLDPEFTNNYEMGYSTVVKGTSLNFTGFVRNSNNAIQSMRWFAADTIKTTFANIGRESAYGMSFFANVSIGKLSLNGGGDVFFADLANNVPDPTQNAANTGWVYSGRMFGSYDLGNRWALQGFAFYRGRRIDLQGFQGGIGIYSLGVRKEFKNKKGSVGLGLENFMQYSMRVFNGLQTPLIDQRSTTVLNNLSFRANFSYRIGKMSFEQPRRRGRSVNNDDLKDGDGGGDGGGGGGMGGFGGGGNRGGPPANVPARTTQTTAPAKDPAASVKPEGTWNYTVQSPQGGEGKITIEKTDGKYSGTITSTRGNRVMPLQNVRIEGNEISFSYTVSFGGNSSEVLVKGAIAGDELTGAMTLGQFGSFPLTAKRAQQ